ncbi:hypothetical protein I8J29_16535 [Paenibacillus sp. MWE-103]|uniref:Uncharacterized protein n=1 Tax=Paenibacillus artemisiicola TaxID=1172618 RepID=A0ABS3WBX9_9BACL|nr:hypothetical protein [Paenibacillus artemisiicola]MBO7745817.1 hypothetical protein [Paenibacillus artemisiicola]
MEKIITIIVVCIIVIGLTFWVFNNPNGIGPGLDQGGRNVKDKIVEATK